MRIDEARLGATQNNLTLVRLVLASAVIWTHSIWRVTGIEGRDEFAPWLGAPISQFAVDGFFFLSGFLVYASLLRRGRVGDFLLARLARLWPALFVSVVATAAVGWFLTTTPGAYLRGDTLRFTLGNLSLVNGYYTLTGVQCGAAACNLNGSLWTITWEARCYVLLALLTLVGLARPAAMRRVVLPLTLAFAILWHLPGVQPFVARHLGHAIAYNLTPVDRLWSAFALGIAAYLWRARIPLSWGVLAAAVLLLVASTRWLPVPHLGTVVIAYAVLCGGFLSARARAIAGRWPDYSYGMYIYAFPVMMALAALIPFGAPPLLALATFLATLPLAALSWHWVEEPALKAVRSRRPLGQPSAGGGGELGGAGGGVGTGQAALAPRADPGLEHAGGIAGRD